MVMVPIQDISYVLVYGDDDCCSESCCSSRNSKTDAKWRELFHRQLNKAGLKRETIVDPHNEKQHFVLISTDFDTLAKQAELMRLKFPLKFNVPEEEGNSFKRWCPCCSKSLTKKLANCVHNAFHVDKEIDDFIARKFVQNDFHVYRDSARGEKYFFRPSLRSLLVYTILIELDITEGEMPRSSYREGHEPQCRSCASGRMKHGLLNLHKKGIYTAHFPLHDRSELDNRSGASHRRRLQFRVNAKDTEQPLHPQPNPGSDSSDERMALYDTWFRCPSLFKFQPFWRIRDYFGEKIAFYFAWCGHLITLLWLPALVGIGVFGYGLNLSIQRHTLDTVTTTAAAMTTMSQNVSEMEMVLSGSAAVFEDALAIIRESFDNDVTPWFALFICVWGTLFTETWRRRNATLAYEWDVDQFEQNERDRPEYKRQGSISHRVGIRYSAGVDVEHKRQSSISHRETDRPVIKCGKYMISFIILLIMVAAVGLSVAGVILFRIVATVDWFPEREHEKYRFLAASILPPVMNALSSLVLERFYNRLALRLTRWENHQTQTQFDDALILKVFLFQFVNCYSSLFYIAFFQSMEHKNGVFGQGNRYLDTCGPDKNCMSVLSFQLLVMLIMKPVPKFCRDILLPITTGIYHWCCRCVGRKKPSVGLDYEEDRAEYVSAECRKKDLNHLDDFTLFEYSEKVIQFGYVTLFAASFPLAPLVAFVFNVIDIRVDACRLLKLCRRPVGFIAEDIGMWERIIKFLSFTGVVTNAFIIAFTSQWGQRQTTSWQFWIIIGFQNICICLKFLLAFFIPNASGDLRIRMAHEKHWVKKTVKELRGQHAP